MNDFEQAKKIDNRLKSVSAFTFCIIQCLHAIEQHENKFGYNGNITYVFESGDRFGNELSQLEREIKSKPRFRFGGWSTADKRKFYPLQAADILCL